MVLQIVTGYVEARKELPTSMRNLREAKMVVDSFLPDEIEAGKN